MQKITELHTFLVGLDLVAAENISSVVDDVSLAPALRQNGVTGQLVAADINYSAMFFIERYPYNQKPAKLLFAQISAWLIQNDTGRTDPVSFPMIVEVNDNDTADLEFGITFREQILITEDATGSIDVDGKKYRLL